jgi:hypothetical protein
MNTISVGRSGVSPATCTTRDTQTGCLSLYLVVHPERVRGCRQKARLENLLPMLHGRHLETVRPVLQGSSGTGAASAVWLAAFRPSRPCNAGASVSASWVPYGILAGRSARSTTSKCRGPFSRRGQHHAPAARSLVGELQIHGRVFYGVGTILITSGCLRASRRLWPSGRDIPVCFLIGRRPTPSCPGGQHQALVERPCSIRSRGGDHGRRRTDKAPASHRWGLASEGCKSANIILFLPQSC